MESVGWTKTSGHLDLTDKREYSVCNKHRDYNLKFCICRNWGRFECNLVCNISLPLKLLHATTQSSSGHHKHVTVPVFTLEELWFNNTRWPICNIPQLSFPSKAKQKLKGKTENSFPLHSCFGMAAAAMRFSSHLLPLRPSWQHGAFDILCGSFPQQVWRPWILTTFSFLWIQVWWVWGKEDLGSLRRINLNPGQVTQVKAWVT